MTTSSKIKIYLDYYNLSKSFDDSTLLKLHVQCLRFAREVEEDKGACAVKDIWYQVNSVHDRVIVDIYMSRHHDLAIEKDYLPYCQVLGIDEAIGYVL